MMLQFLAILIFGCVSVDSVKDYGSALGKSILFYDAQRSGKLPANNPIHWRGDSALHDCVVGGWYDAGDHIKFGTTLASSATILLWSLYKWKDGYQRANQLNQMYDMIKWPLDYFLRAWNPSKQEFTFQVGDETLDHNFWGRPEDMTMSRPCKVASVAHPNVRVYYLYSLLVHRGLAQTHTYASKSYKDELCEAGVWLYRATKHQQYLTDAKSMAESGYIWALIYTDKQLSCNQLLYEETKDNAYRTVVVNYFHSWFPGGNTKYTPCGLAWAMKWGSLRLAANSAFIALVAADSGIDAARYRQWAVEQINYILGDNHHDGGCYSFQIGYGSKFPRQPHHRAASCPSKPAPCTSADANSHGPNPHVLTGALVGGPDEGDQYVDVRSDYVLNEVAIDYNAGFHGALAGIVHLQAHNQFPTTHNKCPCNQ
uniref:Endoglucanase n=1 Tax=Biomphalaria glabrata TaxID=6526 RepID=A0A2C9JY97_BIOGL